MEIQERKWYVGAVAEPALMRLTVKAPTKDGFGLVVLAEAARRRLEAERGLDLGSVDLQWTAGPRQVTWSCAAGPSEDPLTPWDLFHALVGSDYGEEEVHAAAEGVARFGPDREEWPTSDEVRAIQQAVGSGWLASYELEGKDGEPLFHGILQVERPAARLLLDLNRRLAAVREECGPAVERALRKAIDRAIGTQAPDPSRVAAVRTYADYERLEAEFGDACEQALRDDPGFPPVLQTDRGIATEVVVLVRLQVPSVLQSLAGRPRRPGAAKRL